MKIGIEVQRLFRSRKYGIEASALELIKAMGSMAPHHEYVIFAKNDKDTACLPPSENLRIKTLGGKLFADFEQIFLPLAASHEHVDLLHCTGNTTPYFCPVPIVQTLHDVIFLDAIPSEDTFYQRFGNHYRRKIVPLVTPRSKVVITVSHYEKQRIIQRLHIDPDKIHVVYNGINEKRFNANYAPGQVESLKRKYRLPDDFILFLGNPSARKNPGRVIEAYVKYASRAAHPTALVSPGLPEKFVVDQLRDLNYPYNAAQFITPGYIADEDLPLLYGASKMFLFPSLSEGFGMPIIEAMACGTPVITSNVSCMPEIAGKAALLVDPRNIEQMAAFIESLSKDENLRKEYREAGLANANRFSWNKTAESVLCLYDLVYEQVKHAHKTPGFFHRHVFATRD